LTKVNSAPEADKASPLDLSPIRMRVGHGRHGVKDANAFPDMLDEVKANKNSDGARAVVASDDELSVEFGGDVDSAHAEQHIDDTDIPDEVTAYLQKLAAFMQRPIHTPSPVPKMPETVEDAEETPSKATIPGERHECVVNLADVAAPRVLETKLVEAAKDIQTGTELFGATPDATNPLPAPVERTDPQVANTLVTLIDKISSGNFEPKKAGSKQGQLDVNDRPRTILPKPQFLMRAPVLQQQDAVSEVQPRGKGAVEEQNELVEDMKPPQIEPGDTKPQVLKVETSFAPTAPLSLVTQFARAVATGLEGLVQGAAPINANGLADPRQDVVKNLQLRLHPADLGEIKVGMHLRGDELHLKIEVTTKEVQAILQNDKQVLRELIGKAGYDIADASILISYNAGDLSAPPQRQNATYNPPQDASVGQGSRHHPGAGNDNRNQFQNSRGSTGFRPEFEGDTNAKIPQADRVGSRRGGSVFI
jgi:Flagellar hook-length control protein FliK